MNKLLTTLIIISCFIVDMLAQNPFTGMVMEDEQYEKQGKLPLILSRKFSEVNLKHSLKEYCPIPADQAEIGSCVGWSTGYAALSIMEAIENGTTDRNAITKNAYSALWPYHNIRDLDNCNSGARFLDAFYYLMDQGNVKYNEFDSKQVKLDQCPIELSCEANKTKILDYVKLFDVDDSKDEKILKMRQIIGSDTPVLVGMMIDEAFTGLYKEGTNWVPSGSDLGGHAMVVIGYDDRAGQFEILNSWGQDWGDNGFCKVSYDDFAKKIKYAYHMVLSHGKNTPTVVDVQPDVKDDPKVEEVVEVVDVVVQPDTIVIADIEDPVPADGILLTGEFYFKSLKSVAPVEFENQQVLYNSDEFEYQMIKKDWKVGDGFQLIAKGMEKGEYLYVFSVDSENKPFVHWPKNEELNAAYFGMNERPIIPIDDAEVIIPSENSVLNKEKPGDDYLFILYSAIPIDNQDLLDRIDLMLTEKMNLNVGFYTAFGDIAIPSKNIDRAKAKMSISAYARQGYVAPIILKVPGQ